MNVHLKITTGLLATIRQDLRRPHEFAHERVGFISAGLSESDEGLLVLAQSYRTVADENYMPDTGAGAMMNAAAIRKALQWAMSDRVAIFNVHTHGGRGVPRFSPFDLRESAKFVPDFFKLASSRAHGAIVLSKNAAYGKIWFNAKRAEFIGQYTEVGTPIRRWSAA